VVSIARTKLSGLALGDVVEHAGYPRAAAFSPYESFD
jgi:hypothetical protein